MTQDSHTRPFRFALLCHQRSGSNALSSLLRGDPRVQLYGQLFNAFLRYWRRNRKNGFLRLGAHPQAMKHFGPRPALKPRLERAFVSLTPRTDSIDTFMDRFWQRYQPDTVGGALGFKLHDFQITDAQLRRLATAHVDGTVLLWRRNRLRAAVSWAYAMKTDVWSRTDGARGKQPVYTLDLRDLEWFVDKTFQEVDNWRDQLRAAGANYLELTFEDHISTRNLSGLFDFFGLEQPGDLRFRTEKLASADYAHIANAAEIDRQLSSDEHGRLFD